jgi:urease accessory protein
MNRNSQPAESAPAGELALLRLLHLADSALPIGSLAHSFGIETLVSCELLDVGKLPDFLSGYLQEAGLLEATALRGAFCLALHACSEFPAAQWVSLNDLLSALKPARESRMASATLGKNFLRTVIEFAGAPLLQHAWECSMETESLVHQSTAFGLASAALGFDENNAVLAFLHQMSANLVSACQRLMPLGQTEAMRILWNAKPTMSETAAQSAECSLETVCCTMPLMDWGAMEHAALRTRLFVS